MALPKVDAVVIGAGAGGGVTFCQLAEAGLSVVCLERGRWHSPFEERKDDLVNQRNSSLGVAYGPDEDKNPRVFVDLDGREHVVYPRDGSYQPNAACVGGGTFSYGAQAWRYMPQDFRMRTTYGADRGLDARGLADLVRRHGAVLRDGRVPDRRERRRRAERLQGPERSKPLPMPPMSPHPREWDMLYPAAKRLGLHPFDTPLAINSVPYNGRSACMRIRWCVGFGCETNAKNGTHNTVIPRALATGNAWLRTECKVKEILLDDRGPGARRRSTSTRTTGCRSSRRTSWSSRAGRPSRRGCSCCRRAGCTRTASATATTGWAAT